jgi:hypothetical protein
MPAGEQRADALIAAVPARAWQKISTAPGARPAQVPLGAGPGAARLESGRGHWLLARRPLASLEVNSYCACCGSRCSSTAGLPGPREAAGTSSSPALTTDSNIRTPCPDCSIRIVIETNAKFLNFGYTRAPVINRKCRNISAALRRL